MTPGCRLRTWIALAAAAAALASCDGRHSGGARAPAPGPETVEPDDASGLATGEVILRPPGAPEVRIRVEFALEPAEQEHGLMNRRHLDADAGMLFVFPLPERHHSFWMRNTLIPLDMIFLGADGQVVGVVERAEPLTDTPREVASACAYVLEVNGGFAAGRGIVPGTRMEIVGLER
jgi:uncharacterized protein